jgi:hypothetical protein
MKYLKINLEGFKIKGDPEDEDQLKQDVYERVQAMLEAETLAFSIDDDEEDEGDDF